MEEFEGEENEKRGKKTQQRKAMLKIKWWHHYNSLCSVSQFKTFFAP